MTLTTAAGVPLTNAVGVQTTLSCTGKRADRFTGCTTANPANKALAAGVRIVGTAATVEGNAQVVATLANAWDGNAANNVMVDSTLPFARNTFWVRNTDDNQHVMVTCRGYDSANLRLFKQCNVSNRLDDNARIETAALTPAGTGRLGGFIKIEMQDTDGKWSDVTAEFLSHGIGAPNQPWTANANYRGNICNDPTPAAILRLQRRFTGTCRPASSTSASAA
jgi:hypothetical protein